MIRYSVSRIAKMPTTVLLIRHAQTRSNTTGFYMGWSDEDLDETGYAQARRLSSRLASLPIAAIYTSPLRRATTTAATLGKPHNLAPRAMDELIEINLGEWQGLHADEIKRRWPELWRQSRIDPSGITMPAGESFQQVAQRGILALNAVVAEQGSHVVLVTHEIVAKIIVAHVLRAPYSIYRQFEVSNASLTIIRFADGKSRVVTLNDTAHLET